MNDSKVSSLLTISKPMPKEENPIQRKPWKTSAPSHKTAKKKILFESWLY